MGQSSASFYLSHPRHTWNAGMASIRKRRADSTLLVAQLVVECGGGQEFRELWGGVRNITPPNIRW